MNNPFNNIDRAFEPFYSECVVVKFKSGESQTLKTIVFSDITGDSLNDDVMDSERDDIVINLRKRDFSFAKKLQRGDIIIREETNGKTYKISEIKLNDLNDWIVKARSTNG